MSGEIDDRAIAEAALRRGEPEALATVFTANRERLRKVVEFRLDQRLRGRVSASDVLQEAYLDALKRLPTNPAPPDLPFFIWLRSVALQRLIDVHRHHLGTRARDAGREIVIGQGGPSPEASTAAMAELMGDFTSPSLILGRGEAIARVHAALEVLDTIDREVLALRHFEELSNREVAALLGIQTAAASKRYIRAIDRLRELLETMPGG